MPLGSGEEVIGRYRVGSRLGRAAYRALDMLYERACMLKAVPMGGPGSMAAGVHGATASARTSGSAVEEARRHMRLLARLEHPSLPRVTDGFCVGDVCYLVMEWVAGHSLAALLRARGSRPFPAPLLLAWLDPVMDALASCHDGGLAHQGVRPESLILAAGGNVILVGPGLDHPGESPYLAPELGDGRGGPDALSDIYGLGATLYALLTGHEPIPAPDRLRGAGLSPRQLAPGLPAEVDAVVLRAMALRPQERFENVAEMRLALAAEMSPGIAAPLWGGGLQAVLAASHGALLLYDDFDEDRFGWDTGQSEDDLSVTSQEITGSCYRWQAKALEAFSWWCCPDVPPAADLYATVEARQEHGPWTVEHGLVFRAEGDDHYTFSIRSDQQFTAYLEYQGEVSTLLGWQATPAIELRAANRLSVVATGSHFTLLVNDQVVGAFDDDTLAEGAVGLIVGLDKPGDEAAIAFDRFEVRTL